MSITPERIAEIRLALQDLGRGIYRYNLDLRGNGVASLVTELLDDVQQHEAANERQVAEVKRLRAQVSALTPRWQEGEPPGDTWVWREGVDHPIRVGSDDMILRFPGCCYWFAGHLWAWGTARWAPIPKPVEG